MRKIFAAGLLGAALTCGAAAFTAAHAAVVCNEEGDCWRVKKNRNYGPELKLRVFPDNWRWANNERDRYRWRNPGRGHGYWRNGVWLEIR